MTDTPDDPLSLVRQRLMTQAAAAAEAARDSIRRAREAVRESHTSRTQRRAQKARQLTLVDSLRDAVHKAEANTLVRERLMAVVAHEIRQPIHAARGAVALIQKHLGEEPATAPLLALLDRQLTRIQRLSQDLLESAREALEGIAMASEGLELATVMRQAADDIRPRMVARRQRLSVALPSGAASIKGDPVRLAQVFGNLLENAMKYTPEGGCIWFEGRVEDGSAAVVVRDTGPGIPAEARERIFEMFVRETHESAGAGIGLAITRALVERHGGTIELGRPSQGAEFIVRLPLA